MLDQIAGDTGNPVEPIFVPVSALEGRQRRASRRDGRCRGITGRRCWNCSSRCPRREARAATPFRFPVQRVVRPDHTFRGFAGQIASGTVRPGDTIAVLPSRRSAKVQRIVTWDGDLAEAVAPLSVTLVLDRELDISRGDLIVPRKRRPTVATQREGRAGVDGSARRSTESALSAQARQPDGAGLCLRRSTIAPTSPRWRTSPRRRCR